MAKVTLIFEDTPNGVTVDVNLEGDAASELSVAAQYATVVLRVLGELKDDGNEGETEDAS